jgi:hypothetical protein
MGEETNNSQGLILGAEFGRKIKKYRNRKWKRQRIKLMGCKKRD